MSQSYTQSHSSEFSFDIGLGTLSVEEIKAKYHLTLGDDYAEAMKLYSAQDDTGLDSFLLDRNPPVAMDAAEEVVVPVELDLTPDKPTFGYKAQPRNNYIFVRPSPPNHSGRMVIPPAYQAQSNIGLVRSVGKSVLDVKQGDLVMYDKYAEMGNRFPLMDGDGEIVDLVQMAEVNVTAILTKVEFGEE